MMCELLVEGGERLYGELTIQGSKNSVLPILAATLLCADTCVIENCPKLRDVDASVAILRHLGCCTHWEDSALVVDTARMDRAVVPDALMREMRSSVIFLGAILARCKEATICYPGGCELGPRPIDLHLSALSALGAEIRETGGELKCRGGTLLGSDVYLPMPSVGATENAMLAACGCPGGTLIQGAAREPEIVDLQGFLRAMGAEVSGAGTSVITIRGGVPLHPAEHCVMGDRIAAATYLCAAAAAGGEVELTRAEPQTLTAVLSALEEAGCRLTSGPDHILLESRGPLQSIPTVRTAPYPGFPTDGQAILMAALTGGQGTTMFVENMFDSRYGHVDELRRMGADIRVDGRVAVVSGVPALHAAAIQAVEAAFRRNQELGKV